MVSISSSNVLDRRLVDRVAADLLTSPGLVEKDWHVVRAIGVLAAIDHGDAKPAFSGGTSLSKAWGLIKRFSEDIDFKVAIPPAASKSKDRTRRQDYRSLVITALQGAGFELEGDVIKADEGRFFGANFNYPTNFAPAPGLRPHLKVEMTMQPPALEPVMRPVRSLIAELQQHPPEVAAFPCVDVVETAADKLSALAWRVCTRRRGSEKDDPTIIRHLHDLGALESRVAGIPTFVDLVRQAAADDAGRGGGTAPAKASDRFVMMLDLLSKQTFWAAEYEQFVSQVSFAPADETVAFSDALAATGRLVALVGG